MTRRSLIIGLLVSLAFNCLLVGLLVGDRLAGRANALGAPIGRLVEVVPPEARPDVRKALLARRFELFKSLREVKKARDRVQALAAGNPVPEAELQQAFADVRAATDQLQVLLHEAMLEGLGADESPPE